MYLTKIQLRKLDTFQLKGLRKILKMKTTYIDRSNTNKRVREEAATKMDLARKRVPNISKQVTGAQHKLLMHTLREAEEAPTRKATFRGPRGTLRLGPTKRVGRPRKHWTVELMKQAWKQLRPGIPPLRNKQDRKRSKTIQDWIHSAAVLHLL